MKSHAERGRFSSRKKMDLVLRVLRGEECGRAGQHENTRLRQEGICHETQG